MRAIQTAFSEIADGASSTPAIMRAGAAVLGISTLTAAAGYLMGHSALITNFAATAGFLEGGAAIVATGGTASLFKRPNIIPDFKHPMVRMGRRLPVIGGALASSAMAFVLLSTPVDAPSAPAKIKQPTAQMR